MLLLLWFVEPVTYMPENILESTLCRTGTFHTTAYQLVICQPCLHHIVTTTGFDTYDQTLFAISDKLCTITCHFLFPYYVALVPEVTAQFFSISHLVYTNEKWSSTCAK